MSDGPSGASRGDLVPTPERRLSPEEFERVIRRAAELQAASAERATDEGVAEGELVRIGKELGLSTMHLNQALAEVRGAQPAESGVLVRAYGGATVSASRTVQGSADELARRLEQYFRDWEYLTVFRRLRDRTVYTRATGVVAAVGRAATQMTRSSPPLKVDTLDVAVRPLEEGFSHVTLATELKGTRAGLAAVAALGGGGGGTAVAVALGIAIAPPAALLGLPVLGGVYWGTRAAYDALARQARSQLESLLDRIEHGELPGAKPGWGLPGHR